MERIFTVRQGKIIGTNMADIVTESDEQVSSVFLSKSNEHLITPDEREIELAAKELNGKTLKEIAYLYARMESERNLYRNLSETDPLTRLYNRSGLESHWDDLKRRYERQAQEGKEGLTRYSVVFLDLVGLKKANDTYGEYAGDNMITSTARSIKTGTRPDDIGCRYGGDEFVVVLPGADEEEAFKVTARIQESLNPDRIQFVAVIGQFDGSVDLHDSIKEISDNLGDAKDKAKKDKNGRLAESFGIVLSSQSVNQVNTVPAAI